MIEVDLEHVRWLLDEVPRWDESLAPRGARAAISEYYRRQEQVLVDALTPPVPAPEVQQTPTPPPLTHPPEVMPEPPPIAALPPVPEPLTPPPPPEPPQPKAPSRWQLTWKPFLHESLGWFLGAFLILAGALYLVADAWSGMTSTLRALTVFGMMEAWSVGFALWAAALSRKETTRAAAVGLRRIAALVAPLAVVALGPALDSGWSWVALLGGAAVAGALALRAAKDLEEPAGLLLTTSVSLATVGLGLAPVLPSAGGWLLLVPAALAVAAFRRGPRGGVVTTLVAFGLPVAAVTVRLLVSPVHQETALAAMWVALAGLASAALWLRDEPTRGALTVVAMAVFGVAFAASFVSVAPACVLIAVLGAWTTWRLAREAVAVDDRRAWWLAGTYAFAYLAWQRVDQLVPAIVWTWWDALKAMLGYSTAPMPASYGSVYQAVFIATAALVVWLRAAKIRAAFTHVWLRCSSVAAVAAGALALVSVTTDARPAVVALPVLVVPMLVIGMRGRRLDALVAGAVLGVFFAVAAGVMVPPGLAAAVVAVGLALLAHALVAPHPNPLPPVGPVGGEGVSGRRWVAAAALVAGGVSFLLAAPAVGPLVFPTLVLGSVACVLAARALHRSALMPAWFTVLVPLMALERPVVAALVALLGAGLARMNPRRWRAAVPLFAALALLAPAWSLLSPGLGAGAPLSLGAVVALLVAAGATLVPSRRWWWAVALGAGALVALLLPVFSVATAAGLPWLLAAAALGLLSVGHSPEREWLQVPAILSLVVAVSPHFGLWSGWTAPTALASCGVLVLLSSVLAVQRGRSWQGMVVASLSVLAALSTLEFGSASLAPVSVVVLLATPALFAWLTVPLAAALLAGAWFGHAGWLLGLAAVTALAGLLEESDWAWARLLNRASAAWAASVTSALLLVLALVQGLTSRSALAEALAQWFRTGGPLANGLAQDLPPLASVSALFPVAALLATLLLPLLWARATRRAELWTVGLAFVAVAGPWWAAPLLALAGGRLLALEPVRRLLGLGERRDAEPGFHFAVTAVVAGVAVAGDVAQAPLWSAALLFMGGPVPALRLGAAVALAVPFAPMHAPLVAALVALGAAAHHAQGPLKRWLGVASLQYVEPVALFSSILGAAALALSTPVTSSVALPLTLAVTAVLLGFSALVPLAVAALGIDLAATVQSGGLLLAPHGLAVAFGAALLALALRVQGVEARAGALWRWLGRQPEGALASPFFWGALALGSVGLGWQQPAVLALAPLLLLTPRRSETAAALAFGALALTSLLPPTAAVPVLCAASLLAAFLGTRFEEVRAAPVWLHGSWLLALLALALAGAHIESPLVPLAWSSAAATVWLLLKGDARHQGWAWAATALSLHVVLGFVGAVLSTGAPKVLILPWWALVSAGLALLRHVRGGRASVLVFGALSLSELLLGCSLLASAQPREAVVAVLAAAVLVVISWRRVVAQDEVSSAWLGQGALVGGALALRVLGVGAMPGLTDAWVLLGVSAVLGGLAQLLAREGRGASARGLRQGAMAWPLLGAVLVPWHVWSVSAAWLMGLSVLGAWLAQQGTRRAGALVSAFALNAAVGLAAVGSGFGALQLLLIPLGLTMLVLAQVFREELSPGAQVQVRAWGMGLVYAAVAWSPLTATSVSALVLCVAVCLAGVALGAWWRIRSYVVLGSGVLVTTVLATLVRSGLAEPRLGALFLSLLGLGVVVVMVVITTRRAELQLRFEAMQRAMSSWEA